MELTLIERACPICGNNNHSKLHSEARFDLAELGDYAFASRKKPELMHLRLLECSNCKLVYASPAPEQGELAKAYDCASFDSTTEARFAARTYSRLLPRLYPVGADTRGALDIGTGDGAFIEEMLAFGFSDVQGVEPSAAPIAGAPAHIRDVIRHDIFRRSNYSPEQFCLVTCFQTIEHVASPLDLCRDAFDILKPGGWLYIVCHNRLSPVNRVLGDKSPIMDVEHLQLFSPHSVTQLVRNAGFQSAKVTAISNKYPLRYWIRLAPLPPSAKSNLLRLAQASTIGMLPIGLRVGNIAVTAQKPTQL